MAADKLKALEDLYAAARFLKRVNVRAFASPERGMVIDIQGGTLDDWRAFWAAMDAVGIATLPETPKTRIPRVTL